MLVLTRKADQTIQIGEGVTVTVLRVRGGAVRIGIDAPRGMKILRGELTATPQDAQCLRATGSAMPNERSDGAGPVCDASTEDNDPTPADGSRRAEDGTSPPTHHVRCGNSQPREQKRYAAPRGSRVTVSDRLVCEAATVLGSAAVL